MTVEVDEADRAARPAPRSEAAAEHDAAVAAQHQGEGAGRDDGGDAHGQVLTEGRDFSGVAHLARRAREVAIGRRLDVAGVGRAEPCCEVADAQGVGRAIQPARPTILVGLDADARARSDQSDGP